MHRDPFDIWYVLVHYAIGHGLQSVVKAQGTAMVISYATFHFDGP